MQDFHDEYDDKMTQYCDTALRCGVDMDLVEILVSADTEFESRDDMVNTPCIIPVTVSRGRKNCNKCQLSMCFNVYS